MAKYAVRLITPKKKLPKGFALADPSAGRDPSKTWTVLHRNEALMQARGVGTFDSEEDARAYAEKEAERSRSFVEFQVWRGLPRNPIEPTGFSIRGKH